MAVDEPLVEISTDKVDAEMPSPVAGTLAEILAEPDETVELATVVCRIAAGRPRSGPCDRPGRQHPRSRRQPAPANGDGQATPVAARIASAHGIDMTCSRAPARAAA